MSEARILYAALHDKAGVELLNEVKTERQLRFMVRVRKGQSTATWLAIIDRLIELGDAQLANGSPTWTIDVSKQYFRKPDLKYGWRVILQGQGLDQVFESLAQAVRGVQTRANGHDVDEIPLFGSSSRKGGREVPA